MNTKIEEMYIGMADGERSAEKKRLTWHIFDLKKAIERDEELLAKLKGIDLEIASHEKELSVLKKLRKLAEKEYVLIV